MRSLLLGLVSWLILAGSVFAQGNPLFWTVRDDQTFPPQLTLNGPGAAGVATLSGRSLVALAEAKRRIGEEYRLQPILVLTNQPGINAFATELKGQSIVAVNLDTIKAIGDDGDMWAALMGHEFGHVYHQHVANHQARAALINLAALVLDAYQQRQGRNRTELIRFGAQLVDNAFTRDQEREADASSVDYMVRAGYNPEGAIRLQQLLMSRYGSAGALSFLQSHPSGEERIQNLRAKIAAARPTYVQSATTSVEFKRYATLCGMEAKTAGIENSAMLQAQYACLKKQNPETAKRFALCLSKLNVEKRYTPGALADCVGNGPSGSEFGYVSWAAFCAMDLRQQGLTDMDKGKDIGCIEDNAPPVVALRGFLCEAEFTQQRLPRESKMATVGACSMEIADMKTRFDRSLWEAVCKWKALGSAAVEAECLRDAPEKMEIALGNNRSALSPKQVLAEIRAASGRPIQIPTGPVTECDQLASTIAFGDVKAQYVGTIDATRALPVCQAEAKSGRDNGRSLVNLAAIHLQQGQFAEAGELAKKALAKKVINAGTVLAVLYTAGLGGYPVDHAKSFALLLTEAKRGSSDALQDLATHIRDGRGIEADPEVAVELLKIAAQQGDAQATAALGMAYSSGRGVTQDRAEGLRLFRQASGESPMALMGLIVLLRSNPNADRAELTEIQTRALELAKRFADMGSLNAKSMLAAMYNNGLGVPTDRTRAVALWSDLAAYKIPSAYMALGFAYLNGTGVPQDKERAIGYFRKAADHGSREAETQIARIQGGR